jgi:hypothetical protein
MRTQWGLGKTFACRGCGTELVIGRQYVAPLVALVGWYLVRPSDGTFAEDAISIAPFLLGLLIYSLFSMRARRANPAPPH